MGYLRAAEPATFVAPLEAEDPIVRGEMCVGGGGITVGKGILNFMYR